MCKTVYCYIDEKHKKICVNPDSCPYGDKCQEFGVSEELSLMDRIKYFFRRD